MNALKGDKDYPRVLLVNTEPISRRYATGITMGNLFRGWPMDRIAQIYLDHSDPDTSICNRSWHMELDDLRMPGWLKEKLVALRAQRKELAGNQGKDISEESVQRQSSFRDYVLYALKKGVFKGLAFSSYSVSSELDEWVRDFSPEVIYSTLGSLHLLKLVQTLSDNLTIPVVPHFMDDWISSLYSKGLFEKLLKFQLLKTTDRLMSNAPVMMVISEAMAEEYQKRYGHAFLPFMNCFDSNVLGNVKQYICSREEFRFVYAGGVHLGRWEMLLDIGQSLSTLASSGTKAVIEIYMPNAPNDALVKSIIPNVIRFCGALPPEKIINILANCDGLLHVESFEEKLKDYTRFSISTKLPEYFSSGTAIFAYGPEDLASIKYISTNNCAVVVGNRNKSLLRSNLQNFIANNVLRSKIAEHAKTLCTKNHDAFSQRERFRSALSLALNIQAESS